MYKKRIILLFVVLFLFVNTYLLQAEGVPAEDYNDEYYRAEVLEVENLPGKNGDVILEQRLKARVLNGEYKGETFTVNNYYKETNANLNLKVKKDMEVILVFNSTEGQVNDVYLYDVSRDQGIYYLAIIFTIVVLLIGRLQGLKTLVTLVYTGIIIVKVMLPMLLNGHDPIVTAVFAAIIIIIPALLTVGGFNSKSLAAIIGTACGVLIAGILALWIGKVSYLTGFSSEEAHLLIYMDQDINIKGLLFAGIIVGSLGAITDVCMSIASAIAEIKEVNPNIDMSGMIQVGLNVGKDIMGTMSNTLLLAYVGGSIPLLLVLQGANIPWARIINMDVIATEFVSGLAGSIGLIIAIPVTTVATAALISFNQMFE